MQVSQFAFGEVKKVGALMSKISRCPIITILGVFQAMTSELHYNLNNKELETSLQKIDTLRQDIRKAEKLRRELGRDSSPLHLVYNTIRS